MAETTCPLIILSAFACEPGRGSEPGVGWEFVRAAATLAQRGAIDVIVLTRPHRIAELESALDEEGLNSPLIQLVGVAVPFHIHRITGRKRVRLAYIAWQVAAVTSARRLVRLKGRAPIYHHVSFATAALPTAGILLPREWTFILGPAGSASAKAPSNSYERVEQGIKSAVSRINVKKADLCIAQNCHIARQWQAWAKTDVLIEPNAMIDEALLATISKTPEQSTRRRIISVGLLRKIKRHDLAIRALAEPALHDCRLTIVGDGPELASLQRLARDIRVEDRVEFTGWLPHEETLTAIANAGCLILASVTEGAGWTVAEAQALGVPVVVRAQTGAETLVSLTGIGTVVSADVQPFELATALNSSLQSIVEQTDRWNRSRLPDTLLRWYSLV